MRNAISAFSISKGVNLNLKSLKLRAYGCTTLCVEASLNECEAFESRIARRWRICAVLEPLGSALRAVILCKTLHDDQRRNYFSSVWLYPWSGSFLVTVQSGAYGYSFANISNFSACSRSISLNFNYVHSFRRDRYSQTTISQSSRYFLIALCNHAIPEERSNPCKMVVVWREKQMYLLTFAIVRQEGR